ncbi:hypothetical protein [Mesorhizobium marinum]|uniref:hypothetical protein n=1 Tax=Mesorhizobium marinum TaxID=3228790 RepID=UPI0034661BCA
MADNTRTSGDELSAEIAHLRRELSNLKAALSQRAGDIAEGAGRAADAVVQPIRNHPGAAGMLFGGLLGLITGLAIGYAAAEQQRPRRWHDRYW